MGRNFETTGPRPLMRLRALVEGGLARVAHRAERWHRDSRALADIERRLERGASDDLRAAAETIHRRLRA